MTKKKTTPKKPAEPSVTYDTQRSAMIRPASERGYLSIKVTTDGTVRISDSYGSGSGDLPIDFVVEVLRNLQTSYECGHYHDPK